MDVKNNKYIVKVIDFYNNIKPKRKFVELAILIHILSFILIITTNVHFYVKTFLILISAVIPILLVVTLIMDTERFKKYEQFKWVSILKYIVITIYLIIANNYASTIINNIFSVDSGLFPVTSILLTLLFPIQIFADLSQFLYLILSIVLVFVAIINIVLSLRLFAIILYLGLIMANNYVFITKIKNNYIQDIALKFDFYNKHRCTNLKEVNKIIFIDSNKVFIYDKNNQKEQFRISNCNLDIKNKK